MKKTDIALIIIIISVSAGLAYWVASATIGQSNEKPITVRSIDAVMVEDNIEVDKTVFSENAINPTVETTITGEDLTSFIDDTDDDTSGDEQEGTSESGVNSTLTEE